MADTQQPAETWLGKIGYALGEKFVGVVGADFAAWWLANMQGQLEKLTPTDFRELITHLPPGPAQAEECTPEQMRSMASALAPWPDRLTYSALGVLGIAKGMLDIGAAGPVQAYVRYMDYDTRSKLPIWLPDPGSIVTAWIKDPDRQCYPTSLLLHGLNGWSQETLKSAARLRLSPSNYWTLYRRGVIGKEDFENRYLSMAGVFKDDRTRIDALNELSPSLADVWTGHRRGKTDPAKFSDTLWALGYRKDGADFWNEVLRADVPLDALTRLWRYGHIDEGTYRSRLVKLGFREEDLADLVRATYNQPDLTAAITLERRGVISLAALREELKGAGYSPYHVECMENLRYDNPDPTTAITWKRRGLIGEDTLGKLFKAAGLSPEHAGHMKALVDIIPGVADLVTMAVREAFTPAAIAKFRLHEDFPPDFAKYAAQQGVSEFWAKAYWASHWVLPGVREVFDIFHRIDRGTGAPLIDAATVDEYLKVADISPFWRPLLRQISFEPYTRVDVRRMYQVGVVDEKELYNTYRDLGYDDDKARHLTDWTVIEYAKEVTDLTRADILDAYRKGLIDRGKASSYLDDIGLRWADREFYLTRTEYQIEQDKKEVTQASLKAMFLEDLIGISEIKDRLRGANYPEGEIARLLNLWQTEKEKAVAAKKAKQVKPTRADLDGFLKAGVIDGPIYEYEMAGLGYSNKYVSWFMQAALGKVGE